MGPRSGSRSGYSLTKMVSTPQSTKEAQNAQRVPVDSDVLDFIQTVEYTTFSSYNLGNLDGHLSAMRKGKDSTCYHEYRLDGIEQDAS